MLPLRFPLNYNILFFIKDKRNHKYIILTVCEENIDIKHNGFNLDQSIMVDCSERIFYETRNPFIISYAQILVILNNHYGMKLEVNSNNQESTIRICLQNNKKNHYYDGNVIPFCR